MDFSKFEGLPKRFAEAGLKLKLLKQPVSAGLVGAEGVVQVDIRREVKKGSLFRGEHFALYPGAPENVIQVRSVDPKIGQVVVMIREQARDFEEEIPQATVKRYQKRYNKAGWLSWLMRDAHLMDKDIAYHKDDVVRVRRHALGGPPRYFLMGVDERQLFMCQLPHPATSVAEAHALLKAPTVRFAEGKAEGRTIRQGEWFMVNSTPEEKHAIESGIAKCTIAVRKNAPLVRSGDGTRPRGKPHVADELVCLPGRLLPHGFAVREMEIYVRGKIRHPDHKTVTVREWRKVVLNTENRAAFEQQRFFGGWID